ncbi:hypothetical protein SAMN05421636_10542 [Pricia antarctica]|uniref:Uncharacterized protein n=1 Tax=Pricia antarctica TaxID=641691 RepID=A0A1G7CUT6_9FLAO|nr:hypothetical protein SAMN05421636_10542 [Pricia antarctica]
MTYIILSVYFNVHLYIRIHILLSELMRNTIKYGKLSKVFVLQVSDTLVNLMALKGGEYESLSFET